jgi:Nucleotidyltransferase substrate binding protein like
MIVREEQLEVAREKYQKVYQLLRASVIKTTDFDSERNYSADELEPYDALSDRFIRTVEVAIKFFRTYEYYMRVEQSQTLRDGLHQMEKLGVISSLDIWLDMRDIRNRIVHDYTPEKIAQMVHLVRNDFYEELTRLDQFVVQVR